MHSPMTPAHHKACSREWESRLIVSRVLLDRDRTPTTAAFSSSGGRNLYEGCLLGHACFGMQGPRAPRMKGAKERGSERKVRSGTHLLSTNLSLMKNEASPLSLAGACSSIFLRWAARVLSGLSPRISLPVQTGGTESAALRPASKAGFSMPTRASLSSRADKICRSINKNTNADMKGQQHSSSVKVTRAMGARFNDGVFVFVPPPYWLDFLPPKCFKRILAEWH